MNILITVHQFFPYYRAGTEILTLSVIKELIKRKHDVRVFTTHPRKYNFTKNEGLDEYQYEGIHIYCFHDSYELITEQMSIISSKYKNKLVKLYFINVCERFQPQLVHHFHLNRLGIEVINYLAEAQIPQYFTPTDFWVICPTAQLILNNGYLCNGPNMSSGNCVKHLAQNFVNQFAAKIIQMIPDIIFDKITNLTKKYKNIKYPMSYEVQALACRISNIINALNKLQGIICPNSFISNLLIKNGVSKYTIYEKEFGINFNKESINIKFKHWDKNKPLRIVFIGTLAPYKGCDIAIKAVNLLPDNFATLTIFGSQEEFPDYVKKLHSLISNNNISFKEEFPNYKIFSILDEYDVLVVPSIWFENTPLIIYFAQAVNCPIIGSNLPGISAAVFHNINGLLFEAGNYKDLCKKIQSLRNVDLTSLSRQAIKPKTICQYVNDICDIWNIGIR